MLIRHWFAHPELLFALAVLPVLGVFASADSRRRRRVLSGFVGPANATEPRRWGSALRGLCLLLGLLTAMCAAAGPRWGVDPTQQPAPGRDLIFVLDCSRSMLAETPSRLERARTALLDLSDTLARVGGHRVALVTFAARARVTCPLTRDYDHFRECVRDLEPTAFDAELGPVSGSVSGTRIGLALCEALRAGDARFANATDIWLLSDGDDPARDGEWQAGVDAARAGGIRVYTVGIGNPDAASTVTSDSQPLRHEGKDVRTKLEEAPLRTIAESTGGTYFAARDRTVALGKLCLETIAARPERDSDDDSLPVVRDRSAWFYEGSFAFLAGSILFGAVSRTRGKP